MSSLAWNYVFVKDTTPDVCNVTLDQTTTLSSSLYVEGNLCFKNSASISESNSADPVFLEVRGKLVWLSGCVEGRRRHGPREQRAADVGEDRAAAARAPSTLPGTRALPCSPTNDYFYVKSGGYSTSAPAINAPTLTSSDWDGYYQTATISRLKPCNSGGLPGTSFDNDTTRNNSLAYDVRPDRLDELHLPDHRQRQGRREPDWDPSTRFLDIRGTVFIDGNVSIDGVVKYRGVNVNGVHPAGTDGSDGEGGQMVMYVSGNVSLSNTGVFCGWDMAARHVRLQRRYVRFLSAGPRVPRCSCSSPVGRCTLSQGSYFQGALYTAGNVSLGQSAQTEGPLIAGSLTLGQSVKMKPLPGLADLPLGAPGNPNTSGFPTHPSYGGG